MAQMKSYWEPRWSPREIPGCWGTFGIASRVPSFHSSLRGLLCEGGARTQELTQRIYTGRLSGTVSPFRAEQGTSLETL